MPSFTEHCAECRAKLGNDFAHVHHWLDEYAKLYRTESGCVSMRHWLHRHHKAGVEEVRRQWGDGAAKAAELHILADYAGMGVRHLMSEQELETVLDQEPES